MAVVVVVLVVVVVVVISERSSGGGSCNCSSGASGSNRSNHGNLGSGGVQYESFRRKVIADISEATAILDAFQ